MRKAIAIDFDGCLCEWAWPEIGAPHTDVINKAIREQVNGTALILWTCRVGRLLEDAVDWCRSYGLEFDAVNANLPDRITAYRNDCRKVSADEYWDDRAIHMPQQPNDPLTLEELRETDGKPVYVKAIISLDEEWCIVKYDYQMKRIRFWAAGGMWYDSNGYGDRILAYHRKPEEGA